MKKFKTILEIGGFIFSFITVIIVVLQFLDRPDPLKETRINNYKGIIDITGKIVNTQDNDSLTKLSNQFMEIYWGYYMLVNDSMVIKEMKRFKFELEDKIKGNNNVFTDKYKTIGKELIQSCQKRIISYQ